MRVRKLRIAWSVLWGLGCVLLFMLWVRSIWSRDVIHIHRLDAWSIDLESSSGAISALVAGYRSIPRMFDIDVSRASGFNRTFEYGLKLGYSDAQITLPYWMMICFGIAVSGAPLMIRWPNRFGLRALLLATTLVAIVLGLIAWLAS